MIVQKPIEIKPLTLFQNLGGIEGLKVITDKLFERMLSIDDICDFFKKTNIQLQKKKFS